jgi:hypothetical protein
VEFYDQLKDYDFCGIDIRMQCLFHVPVFIHSSIPNEHQVRLNVSGLCKAV